jgi:tripartite-type tricarboxylate transporter receptor subunit TctC
MLCACLCGNATAQDFPNRPLRIIVPVSAGGGADTIGRVISRHLQELLGQPVIVDNRPGADTNIGTTLVAKSLPDGYTMLLTYSIVAVQPSLATRLPYDLERDLAPVINLMDAPSLVCAKQSLPVNSIRELIALAKAKPGNLTFAESGTGGPSDLAALLFNSLAGVKMLRVPYKGAGPALIDLVGGHVDVSFATIVSTVPLVRSGKLKALAVTGSKRSPVLPELPTVAESGVKDYEYVTWYGVFVRAGTPRQIIDKLYSQIHAIIMRQEIAHLFAEQGAQVSGSGPQEFSAYISAELKKWARVIKEANIRVDP